MTPYKYLKTILSLHMLNYIFTPLECYMVLQWELVILPIKELINSLHFHSQAGFTEEYSLLKFMPQFLVVLDSKIYKKRPGVEQWEQYIYILESTNSWP